MGCYSEKLRVGKDHDLFGKLALQYPVAYSPKVCSRYSLAAENNTDTVDYVLEVPLEKYLNEHDICKEEEKTGFPEYLDHWRIRTGGRNIYSGFRKEGRAQIRKVSTKKSWMLKYGFSSAVIYSNSLSQTLYKFHEEDIENIPSFNLI